MSNTAASPGSRPLEQLKVAELRDELRKRGLSIKGVKKELCERLDEALKKEEQEGIVYGEHEATEEGDHKMGTSDETEDVEGEGAFIDGSKGEATKSPDTAMACEDDILLDTPLQTTEEPTPFSEGTHTSPSVSAPNEAHGSNEDSEQHCTVAPAGMETNNDVMSVHNAACGNGDVKLLPDNAANAAAMLEPCKDTSGKEHACVNDETQPEIVVSELADTGTVDVLPESGSVSSVIENVVPDVPCLTGDNGDTILAVDNTVCGTSGDDGSVHEVETVNLKGDQPPLPDTSAENPSLEGDDKSSMQLLTQALDSGESVAASQEAVVVGGSNTESSVVSFSQFTKSQEVFEAHAGVEPQQLERPNGDGRDLIRNEDKCDVKLEEMVNKCEVISEGGLEKSSVKTEPMEIETCAEERHKAICDVKMEPEDDKEDHDTQLKHPFEELQMKEVISHHDDSHKSRGEEGARGPDDERMGTKDDANLKAVDDNSQARINLKRKDSEADVKQQEPAKRMRRWNSGKEVVVDALKPLTTDTMKEIMLPNSTEGSSVVAQRLTPKAVATSRALPAKVKVEPEPTNNTRIVPPSPRAPSNSLKVERFVRPFTLNAVKDLLAEFGQFVDFWMDQIKTHCFVTYSSVNEAVAARSGLYGRQWPPSVGNCLTAEFVDVNEVKIRSEGLAEKAQASPAAASMRVSNSTPLPPSRTGQSASSVRNDPSTIPPSRFVRDVPPPPAPKKDPEPAVVTLEDLFFKTKAKPHIYYLPLTEEQVAEKIKNKQAVR